MRLAVGGRNATLNAAAAAVVEGLSERGVPSIVLKGPATVHWLYEASWDRPYSDADVLVPPDGFEVARTLLQELGYRKHGYYVDRPDRWIPHDETWTAPQGDVDLHRSLPGVGVDPGEAWTILNAETVRLTISGTEVRILNRGATALHLALNAVAHGVGTQKSVGDLERAVATFPLDEWSRAAQLAERLNAVAAFATGVRLVPAGIAIARELRLPDARSERVALAMTTPPRGAKALQRLSAVPSARARALIVLRWLFPSVAHMRASSPGARRGALGLIAAYAYRQAELLRLFFPALRALRRARRRAGKG